MNRPHVVVVALALCGACAPNLQHVEETSVLEGAGRDPHERELNRAALEELRERAATAEPQAAHGSGDPLEVVVLGPPPAVTDDGELRRTALDAFLAQGPHAVLTAVDLEPVRDDADNAVGFRIAALNAGSGFVTGGGLRVGDVVTRVNGRSILLPDAFLAVWEGLATADELRVELVRDGRASVLSWPIRQDL